MGLIDINSVKVSDILKNKLWGKMIDEFILKRKREKKEVEFLKDGFSDTKVIEEALFEVRKIYKAATTGGAKKSRKRKKKHMKKKKKKLMTTKRRYQRGGDLVESVVIVMTIFGFCFVLINSNGILAPAYRRLTGQNAPEDTAPEDSERKGPHIQ